MREISLTSPSEESFFVLAQKWVARGLRKDVMIEIAKVVGTPEIEEYLA
jgi:hypothetical protein